MKVCLILAFALFAPLGPARAQAAVPDELPSGSSAIFRERMLDWSALGEDEAALPALPATGEPPHGAALPRLSSGFGYRANPVLRRRMLHSGIDIPGPAGTAVLASDSGVVRHAGIAGGYGKMVEIGHAGGLATRYAHLSRILVEPGATVRQGELIGLMGSTGRSTGSHLHFEIRAAGRAIDPLPLFRDHAPHAVARPSAPTRVPMAGVGEPHISAFASARDSAGIRPGSGGAGF